MAELDGVKEIFLKTAAPAGVNPDSGYIYKWIEKVGGEHIYKGKDSSGVEFNIGTTGGIISTWEPNAYSSEGITPIGNKKVTIGSPATGAEAVFGYGDSYTGTDNILVYTYGTIYEDVTSDVVTDDLTTISFPALTDGNMIYFASKLSDGADKLPHLGLKLVIDTAAVLGAGDIAIEFYNGTAWEEVNHMSTMAEAPYNSYANEKMETAGTRHYLYNQIMTSTWTKNDPVGAGTDYYWCRYRIAGTITTAPIINRIKIHPLGRLEINEDGFITKFGISRTLVALPVSYGQFAAAANSPVDSDVYVSDNLDVGMTENTFQNNTIDRSGFKLAVPKDICTACPVRMHFLFFPDTNVAASTVDFVIRWGLFRKGSTLYTSQADAPASAIGEKSISASYPLPANQDGIVQEVTIYLDIAEALPPTSLTGGDTLVITFERLGSTDAYGGNIIMTDVKGEYSSWSNGGHL